MRVQVSLTPNEGKRIIAKAVAQLPEVKTALRDGRILLKGGTTVSAVAEELAGVPLRISGRISARGTLAAVRADASLPHSLLIEGGKPRNADDDLTEAVRNLGRGDVIVIGANALDAEGNAAMMAGSVGGFSPGLAMTSMMTEGAGVIIAVGLDKLIPGRMRDAVAAAGRKGVEKSVGMAVGLMPLFGRVITEKDALEVLAPVRAAVIGRGGAFGGEGSTVLVVEGDPAAAKEIFDLVLSVKGTAVSGTPDSFAECSGPNSRCVMHLACIYKTGNAAGKEEA
jgi:hypothetical protein